MNKITKLFNIKYPIIQGGMIWCSGWRQTSAVSNIFVDEIVVKTSTYEKE